MKKDLYNSWNTTPGALLYWLFIVVYIPVLGILCSVAPPDQNTYVVRMTRKGHCTAFNPSDVIMIVIA